MNNLEIWDKVRTVPTDAQKTIRGGRTSGMTDINPQWRIEKMTEIFGPVGIGWNYRIDRQWVETLGSEVCAYCNVEIKFKQENEWSEWIPGTGGSRMQTMEKNGIYVSDEAYKMALTDALSVAMKAIGIGADIYRGKSDSKYSGNGQSQPQTATISDKDAKELIKLINGNANLNKLMLQAYNISKINDLPKQKLGECKNRITKYMAKVKSNGS